jgi:hypothetical protein
LPPLTGLALPESFHTPACGGSGFSRGESGIITTTVVSLDFGFDVANPAALCWDGPTAADEARRT